MVSYSSVQSVNCIVLIKEFIACFNLCMKENESKELLNTVISTGHGAAERMSKCSCDCDTLPQTEEIWILIQSKTLFLVYSVKVF